jgi:tetratricopeptide (TPR) repeat protein
MSNLSKRVLVAGGNKLHTCRRSISNYHPPVCNRQNGSQSVGLFHLQKSLFSSEGSKKKEIDSDKKISITLPLDLTGLSPIDIEKELFTMKRRMGQFYSKGMYEDALECAVELEINVKEVMGTNNAIYASSLNNVAIMNKMLGRNDDAMTKYTEALHIYKDVVGRKHPSYASTLANIGVLYKVLAEASSGIDKTQLIDRAEEALLEALNVRIEILGPTDKNTLTSSNHLSSLWRVIGKVDEAEKQLKETLQTARNTYGEMDAITATTLNNLGRLLKEVKKFDEAEICYKEALNIRSSTLGDPHQETIVSMNNLAECLLARGTKEDIEEANVIQLEIIRLCGGKPENEDENENEDKNENENVTVTKNINTNKNIDVNNNINNDISTPVKNGESVVIDDSKAPLVSDDIEKNTKINDEKDLEKDNEKTSNIPINMNYSTRSRKSAK